MKRSQPLRRSKPASFYSGKIGFGKGSVQPKRWKTPSLNIKGAKLLYFTAHSRAKMRQYGLSESRVKRVMHSPKRLEEGIAPKTIAMMQPNFIKNARGKELWTQEIWIMVEDEKSRRKIISAWRYPGMTKPGEPLPEEILREIRNVR